ncbi:acyl-protein thioesterase [Thoreauomyces humboldtii]|nr:acyl-protein thioesterase [Thoreauomyces humboldtii]
MFFLHGLGDSGHGWIPVAQILQPLLPHVKFVLPHAPSRPVTVNFGMAMPAWYDIANFGPGGTEDSEGVSTSVSQISHLINEEIKAGIPANRIVLGGFSQGSAVSIIYSLASEIKLAGFVALSGYLPLTNANLEKIRKPENKDTAMLMCHGAEDEVVAYRWGKMSYEKLLELGKKVNDFKTYRGMGHSSCPEEIQDVAAFLQSVLP